jgi:hypothetical protein
MEGEEIRVGLGRVWRRGRVMSQRMGFRERTGVDVKG